MNSYYYGFLDTLAANVETDYAHEVLTESKCCLEGHKKHTTHPIVCLNVLSQFPPRMPATSGSE